METSDDLANWVPRSIGGGVDDLTVVPGTAEDHGDRTSTIMVRFNTDYSLLPKKKLFFRLVATEL